MTEVDRLCKFFRPTRYDVHITPNKKNLTFKGSLNIVGKLVGPQKTLRLHAKELTVQGVQVNGQNRIFTLDAKKDELVINLEPQDKGNITANINFSGEITKPMHGLYPCYPKGGGVILATQFESHHAREVFPCIDEPEAKAVFSLSLTTPKTDVVIANTEPIKTTVDGKNVTTTFTDTPIMSSYLLAFVTGPLHAIKGKTKNGTLVRVWASNDHADETLKFALSTAIKATEFFNDYFDTPYPLTKCDHVALPDFSNGAMENWGLITYRESCLLVDPASTSTNTKEFIATIIAHELSHQWFGNLVTMRWWDDLWLNESFATLMEYLAVDHLYPEWDIMLTFASGEALSAFWRDSIASVQAVQTSVKHPDEISTLFDPSIVYAKGARLLLMAHNLVGDKAFKKGLRLYFERHAYKNTIGSDLWQALEDASGKQVKRFMQAWITQPGFPLLRVTQDGQTLKLSQQRFSDATTKSDNSLWPIPLNIKPSQKDNYTLNKITQEYRLKTKRSVRLNTMGAHYSVRYELPEQRAHLSEQLKNGRINPSERLLALNDSLMQTRAGYCSITETMQLISSMRQETEDPVWGVMSLCISDAKVLAEGSIKPQKAMKMFAWDLIADTYTKLGWRKKRGESLNTTKLRSIILGLATYSEQPQVIEAALEQYNTYKDISEIPADTRHIILAAAIKHGNKSNFNKLLKLYPKLSNAELAQDVAGALTNTQDLSQAKQILSKITDSSFSRLQDFDRWLIGLLRNHKTRALTWRWFTTHWPWIVNNFSSDKSYDSYPRYVARIFKTSDDLDKYDAFFGPLASELALRRNIELGRKEIIARIAWCQRDSKALATWLNKNVN